LVKQIGDQLSSFTDFSDWWGQIGASRQNVVVCLVYNMNLAKVQGFHQMISALSSGDYARAGDELHDSEWYNDVGPDRGDRMIRILKTGVWE
jgi:lysozyme